MLDQTSDNILKDEIILLTSDKAKECGIIEEKLRLVYIYKEDENKVIGIITNQLDWEAETIADLYKKRWDIELFFKAIKQNLQIKPFLGTSENSVKPQIYIAFFHRSANLHQLFHPNPIDPTMDQLIDHRL